MTARMDQARPPRKPMRSCPNCGTSNEPHRTSCRNCGKPMSGSADRPPVTCACGISNHPSRRRCTSCREQLPVSEAEKRRREAIARVVDAAPPLTAQQLVTLRRIFAGTSPTRHKEVAA